MKKKKLIILSSIILIVAIMAIAVSLFLKKAHTTFNSSIEEITQSTDSALTDFSVATTNGKLQSAFVTLTGSPYANDPYFSKPYRETVYNELLNLVISDALYSDSDNYTLNYSKCQKAQQLLDELYVNTPYRDDLVNIFTIHESYFEKKIETEAISAMLYSDSLEKYNLFFDDSLKALNDRNFDLFFISIEASRSPIDELFKLEQLGDCSEDYFNILLDYSGALARLCEALLNDDTTLAYKTITEMKALATDKKNFEVDTIEYLAEIESLMPEANLLTLKYIDKDYESTYDFSDYVCSLLTHLT